MPTAVTAIVVAWLIFVTPVTAQQPAPDATEPGHKIFFAQGCYGCHRLGAAGTPIAYDLSTLVGSTTKKSWRNGCATRPARNRTRICHVSR